MLKPFSLTTCANSYSTSRDTDRLVTIEGGKYPLETTNLRQEVTRWLLWMTSSMCAREHRHAIIRRIAMRCYLCVQMVIGNDRE